MTLCSNSRAVERTQPWLGTLVSVRVSGLGEREAHRAIDAAFDEIATVHRRMSFHDAASDVARLNRAPAGTAMEVHPYTYAVLREAARVSERTQGRFDVTVGAQLVEWDLLPAREGLPPAGGSWRDIVLLGGGRVMFRRPLCVDLGGIAKGFAVDCAIERLREMGVASAVVNAGGDIRVLGAEAEMIRLGAEPVDGLAPVIELADGSVAGSRADVRGPHVDGVLRAPAPAGRFVAVAAERCVTADALTKVVIAMGIESAAIVREFGARAWMHDAGAGWQAIAVDEAAAV